MSLENNNNNLQTNEKVEEYPETEFLNDETDKELIESLEAKEQKKIEEKQIEEKKEVKKKEEKVKTKIVKKKEKEMDIYDLSDEIRKFLKKEDNIIKEERGIKTIESSNQKGGISSISKEDSYNNITILYGKKKFYLTWHNSPIKGYTRIGGHYDMGEYFDILNRFNKAFNDIEKRKKKEETKQNNKNNKTTKISKQKLNSQKNNKKIH